MTTILSVPVKRRYQPPFELKRFEQRWSAKASAERSCRPSQTFAIPPRRLDLTYVVTRHIVVRHMARDPSALLPLTPAMFYVLVALADGETHGYAIMKDVEQLTRGGVRLSTGTLYGIIKRLLNEGLVREQRAADPRRRSYELTPFGREVAKAEAARLEQTLAIAKKKALFRRA